MRLQRKARVTVTVSRAVLEKVDQVARATGSTRSSVVESWLERAARERARLDLEASIAAYYDALTEAERREDAEWAQLATQSFLRRESAHASRRRRRG